MEVELSFDRQGQCTASLFGCTDGFQVHFSIDIQVILWQD